MRRTSTFLAAAFFLFVCLGIAQQSAQAQQEVVVPAGTLLRCTMNEPNFSSATAQVGDPVLCHLSAVTEFGRAAFPRGSYLGGHLEADKEPGHFWGKGYLKIVFDRIGLPNTDAPLDARIIAARGYKVNRDGAILGKGHATRDVVEWLIPPLWPWKVITLPARGPRPALKGEETLTLRLMEDVAIPRLSAAAVPSRDWHAPVYAPQAYLRGNSDSPTDATHPTAYLADQAAERAARMQRILDARRQAFASYRAVSTSSTVRSGPDLVLADLPLADVNSRPMLPVSLPTVSLPMMPSGPEGVASASVIPATADATAAPRPAITLLAMKNEAIYPVTRYWVANDRLSYLLPSGASGEIALGELDWQRTIQLNAQFGVTVTLRTAPSGTVNPQTQNAAVSAGQTF
jgi:hypothetical protein